MTDIHTLITRVLACPPEGDRALDADIAEAMGQVRRPSMRQGNDFYRPDGFLWYTPPTYTTSFDAVEALHKSALPGWSISLSLNEQGKYPVAIMGRSYPTNATVAMEHNETLALAYLAAVLKAKEQERANAR